MWRGPRAGLSPPAPGLAPGVHIIRGQEAAGKAEEEGAERDYGGGGHRPPASPGAPGQV